MSQRNILILTLSLSFGIGLFLLSQVVAHIPDFEIKFKLLLTTGLVPAGFLAFILNTIRFQKNNILYYRNLGEMIVKVL